MQTESTKRSQDSRTREKKVFFKTFGCRTNLYDTEIMRENLGDFTAVSKEGEAGIVVINSCTVTNGADAGVRSYVRRARNLGKAVVFAGCGVGTQGRSLYESGLVDGVLGHSHKERVGEILLELGKGGRFFYEDTLAHRDSTIVSEFVGKARAFVKIQEGCDFACSYCIIPSVRGKARSLPLAHILTQVRTLVDSGVEEVVLTGTNVGSYGRDCASSLAQLLCELFAISGLRRVRIGSLEPSQIDEALFDLLAHPLLERHLHIALQHTHNTMLALMNRTNRVEQDFSLLHRIAKQGYALGTDYIIGHPGEEEGLWEEAFRNLCALPLTHIHPFIYSVRDGTKSAQLARQLPPVQGDIAKQRLHRVKAHIAQANRLFRENLAKRKAPLQVLIEKQLGTVFVGLDEYFNRIYIESARPLPSWLEITDYEAQEEHNYAKV